MFPHSTVEHIELADGILARARANVCAHHHPRSDEPLHQILKPTACERAGARADDRAVAEASIRHPEPPFRQTGRMANGDDLLEDLVSLPNAAAQLKLHRATVNDMVNDGRLRGYRIGPHWYVRKSDLVRLQATYKRPKNSPRRRSGDWGFHWTNEILRWLLAWNSATSSELARVIDLHIGNVRKYLAFCEQDQLAERDDYGQWRLTHRGRERAERLPPANEHLASKI